MEADALISWTRPQAVDDLDAKASSLPNRVHWWHNRGRITVAAGVQAPDLGAGGGLHHRRRVPADEPHPTPRLLAVGHRQPASRRIAAQRGLARTQGRDRTARRRPADRPASVRLFPIVKAWRARYRNGVCFNREHWFALPLAHRRIIRLNAIEHSQFLWLPIDKALDLASSWTNREAMRLLASLQQSSLLAQPDPERRSVA
jgi:hypothetical protein